MISAYPANRKRFKNVSLCVYFVYFQRKCLKLVFSWALFLRFEKPASEVITTSYFS